MAGTNPFADIVAKAQPVSAAPSAGHTPGPFDDIVAKAKKTTEVPDTWQRHAEKTLLDWTNTGGHAVTSVLGAPQSAVAGAATAIHSGHPEQIFHDVGDSVMHDNRPYEKNLRGMMHTEGLKEQHPSKWYDYLRNGAVDVGSEMVTDPLNLTPVGWIGKGAKALGRAAGGANKFTPYLGEGLQKAAQLVDPTRGVAGELGGKGAGELQALENSARTRATEIIKQHGQHLTDPKEQQQAIEDVTRQIMRKEAPAQFGFDAAEYEHRAKALQPMGPHGKPQIKPANIPIIKSLEEKAASQNTKLQGTLTKHGKAQLAPHEITSKPSTVARDLLQRDPQYTNYINHAEHVIMPEATRQMIYHGAQLENDLNSIPAFRGLRHVSNALKDVLFLNPVPHMKNIITLLYESPGGYALVPKAFAIYAQHKSPQFALKTQELENAGATVGFFKERERLFDQLAAKLGPVAGAPFRGFSKWADMSHDALWAFDKSARVALWDSLPASMSAGEKAAYVNSRLIDYAHKSPLADVLSSLGAPFPHWRIENPKRQVRALFENPAAMNRVAQTEQGINNNLPGDAHIEFATPVDEGAKALNPASTLPYLGSTMGQEWREPLRLAARKDSIQDLATGGEELKTMAYDFVPGGQFYEEAIDNPFHSKAPAALRAALYPLGAYTMNNTSSFQAKVRELKAAGMDDYTAQKEARKFFQRTSRGGF